ncbi:MAG TPA: OmpA family protein [Gemmatimonadales bacterium]|nr:OmpA family protein [Gemmatimonadales bacterium]
MNRPPSGLIAARALVLLGLLSSPGLAQSGRAGQVELGTFGSFTRFDRSPDLSSNYGVGGRLGLFVTRFLELETSGDYTVTALAGNGPNVTVSRIGATVLLNGRFFGTTALYVGAGAERQYHRGGLVLDDDGAHGVMGLRLSLGGRAALRGEGRAEYFPAAAGAPRTLNFGGRIGISVFAFGGPPRDADGDRVANRRDRCPNTPAGARVDSDGCPTDEDRDRVFDGLDLCAATPAGATVDDKGCPTDTDKDSVFDGLDLCADTPQGATADPNGCPTDGDRDGVFDGLDRCADTPSGATVDGVGCPTDADGDKVFDGLDQCPGTPPNTEVDARGCTVQRDADGDGVLDPQDRCPNTAAGQAVDAFGCPLVQQRVQVTPPAPAPAPAAPTQVQAAMRSLIENVEGPRRPVVLRGVNFRTGRSDITPESYPILDEVAASLVANPTIRIEIGGHTDATGTAQRNLELSQARAFAVRAYLASKGVAPERMVARGYGPDRPVADNRTPAGRALNRRVELNRIN